MLFWVKNFSIFLICSGAFSIKVYKLCKISGITTLITNVPPIISVKKTITNDIARLIVNTFFSFKLNFFSNILIFFSKKLIGIFKKNAKTHPNITGKIISIKLSITCDTYFKLLIKKNIISP